MVSQLLLTQSETLCNSGENYTGFKLAWQYLTVKEVCPIARHEGIWFLAVISAMDSLLTVPPRVDSILFRHVWIGFLCQCGLLFLLFKYDMSPKFKK